MQKRNKQVGMNDKDIRNLQASLRTLGYPIEDADGTFGASTRQAVKDFQKDHQLPVTGTVDVATTDAIKAVLEQHPGPIDPTPGPGGDIPTPQPPEEAPLFGVRGEVVRPDGSPLQNYQVRAFDRALGNWRPLGEARTNDLGRYQITYAPQMLHTWGKTRADLKVEVYDRQTSDTVLATSPLILQALPQETVNFSIGQGVYRGPDEYTRVDKALTPLLQPVNSLSSLGVADAVILARESKLPNGSVACYIKARRWATALEASPAMFYGLLRQRQPARIDALLARPFSRLWSALENAKAQNVINLELDNTLRNRLAEIQQSYLARPEHPFRQLLQTTALTAEQQGVFTQRLTTGDLTGDEFWNSLEAKDGFGMEQIGDLKATLEIQLFADDNTTLSIHLRSGLKVRQAREVAAFSLEKWRDEVLAADNVEIPDEILPGEPEAKRKAAYAQMLYRSAELHYPTPSLAGQMSRSQGWADRPLSLFLAAHPDYEFTSQRIPFFLKQHPEAVNVFPDPKTGRQELLGLEQVFHLTRAEDKLAAIQPLWDAGLRSARQIAMAGRQQLLRKVGSKLTKSAANRIYHQAVHNTGVALNIYLKYHQGLNGQSLYAMRTVSGLPKSEAEIPDTTADWWDGLIDTEAGVPEWSELFGSPDACECSHCQSTFSPAAYLVDMMYFLQHAADDTGKTALDYLLERRPDLGTLQLTCENSETLMPQIDLAIEIMEQIVAHSADGASIPAGSIGQTTLESEQLAALPEHMDPAAYEKLRETAFPFNRLPFDLWLEEGRRYLKQMNVARDDFMRTMPPKAGVGALQIAGETLGMSTLEREIIEAPHTKIADLAVYWGVDTDDGTLQKQLGHVKTLMKQARIDYDTLLKLLNTRYVNPDRLVSVAFNKEPCSLDGAKFAGPNGAEIANEEFRSFLDRLHRFLRLQRRLGWSAYELDATIEALGVKDFNQRDFIAKLADLARLRESLDLPVGELCAWWGSLDTYRFEDDLLSQYEEVFLDPTVFPDTHTGAGPDFRNEVFALRADRLDLAVTTSTTLSRWLAESDGATEPIYSLQQDYSAYIQSATQLTAEDILLLASEVMSKDATTGNVPLDLANVSLLYRIGSFTRALDLSVQEYLYLVRLLGWSPLTVAEGAVSPSETMAVYERFSAINEGSWELEELVYLLLDDDATAVTYGPTPEAMDALVVGLSPGFVGIDTIETAKANPDLLDSLSQSLGASLRLDAAVLEELLFTLRNALGDQLLAHMIAAANPDLPSPTTSFYDVYETLHKFALVWNGLGLDPTHLAFVVDQDLGWPDVASLPVAEQNATDFEAWRRLIQAAALQHSVFTVEQSVFGLLEAAKDTALSREGFLAQASEWSGWSLEDLTYLTGPDGFNYVYPDAFLDERWVVALEKAFTILRPFGVSAAQAHAWAAAELTFAETESIKQALTLAYDQGQWLDVMAGIQDELRTLKRDALLGCLLDNLSSDDPYDVYRHYLIDPEMDPCAHTSRIVEAHAAVQLFAQRILLNLEPPLSFPREDAEGWQWRKNYRIWEAARKVFLYPENWIEPELRDNKSVFFKEFEDGLLQDEVTFETAERLYREYLYKLDQVSRLEIMGMYQDEETNVLHVFGRSKEISQLYYYRRWEDQARWTPWERVELDIQGDHLIPIVYNGRLYLFWPEFKVTPIPEEEIPEEEVIDSGQLDVLMGAIEALKTQLQNIENDLSDDFGFGAFTRKGVEDMLDMLKEEQADPDLIQLLNDWLIIDTQIALKQDELDALEQALPDQVEIPPKYEIELGMSWSQYQNNAWQPKTLSKQKAAFESPYDQSKHYFTGWVNRLNQLRIGLHTITQERSTVGEPIKTPVGYFYFDECGAELLFNGQKPYAPGGEVYLAGSYQRFQYWDSFIAETFELEITEDDRTSIRPILGTVPMGVVKLHYAHQYGLGGAVASPFFFSDTQRTYFARLVGSLVFGGSAFDSVSASLMRSKSATAGMRKKSGRTAIPGSVSEQFAVGNDYYGGVNDEIISRAGLSQAFVSISAQQIDSLADTLADDNDPKFIPPIDDFSIDKINQSSYLFTRFYHPYTCLFLKQLSRYGIEGLLNPDPEWDEDSENLYRQLTPLESFDFEKEYLPDHWVDDHYPIEEIDFDHDSPYGSYNWELFFHIPLLVATRLMQNQRFSEARRWFNYIFDPTHTGGQAPSRFWKIRPFYEEQLKGPTETLQELMDLLEQGSYPIEQQVDDWGTDPFNPHAIARLRMAAYMKTTVMKYVDCLIAEADQLFTIDSRETINEAAQLYLLAAEILGEKPTLLPAQEAGILTANLLLGRINIDIDWSQWNPLDALNSLFPARLSGGGFSRANQAIMANTSINAQGATTSYDTLLSFCIPHNEKLYGYWDIVADRLFKIRHCMNIAGIARQLPLFAPPIDPGLLVRASAAGLDITAILSSLYQPLPNYRFGYMLQKALEFCGEVRSLGNELLSALEKKDAEGMSLLRSAHEVALLQVVRDVKKKSVEEADSSLASLMKSKESAELRRDYYSSLEPISSGEQKSLVKQETASKKQRNADYASMLASFQFNIPMTEIGLPPKVEFGGLNLGGAADAVASFWRARSAADSSEANQTGVRAGYDRRQEDWDLQVDLARKEIEQLDKQILAAEIRQQIAEADLENHEKQIAQAEEAEAFMKTKFTNQELYSWMVSKLSTLYFQAYQLAYQLAKQVEKAFQHELGPEQVSPTGFIQTTYWDSLKKGLLAGEQLSLDLKRMEAAYLDQNKREYELTRHVSLRQLDPLALLTLKATGVCEVTLPEWLYDLDNPGHYMRRIKNVSLSIPSVTGPYTSVNCTLSLHGSTLRKSSLLKNDEYARQGSEDDRFVDTPDAIQSIVTSSSNNDTGLFETNLRDERFLPFEGVGAESTWTLTLPTAFRQFDYNTISDVILHVRYTARPGGAPLADKAIEYLEDLLDKASESGLALLLSLRHDFSIEWLRFLSGSGDFTATVKRDYFPYFTQGRAVRIDAIQLHSIHDGQVESLTPQGLNLAGLTNALADEGAFVLSLAPDDAVLVREPQAHVFVVIGYSIS